MAWLPFQKKKRSTATTRSTRLRQRHSSHLQGITIAKGPEPMLYEALKVIAGPFFKFTFVKMKRTQKTLTTLKKA